MSKPPQTPAALEAEAVLLSLREAAPEEWQAIIASALDRAFTHGQTQPEPSARESLALLSYTAALHTAAHVDRYRFLLFTIEAYLADWLSETSIIRRVREAIMQTLQPLRPSEQAFYTAYLDSRAWPFTSTVQLIDSIARGRERGATYTIISNGTTPAIYCNRCGRLSYSPEDIENRYCGFCHQYHQEPGS